MFAILMPEPKATVCINNCKKNDKLRREKHMFTTHLLGMALAPNKCIKNQLELAIYFVTSPMDFTVFRKTNLNPISKIESSFHLLSRKYLSRQISIEARNSLLTFQAVLPVPKFVNKIV